MKSRCPTAEGMVLLLLWGAVAACSAAAGADEPDRETLGKLARAARQSDMEALRGLSFRRQVVRQSLGSAGKVKSREVLVLRVTPEGDGWNEELIEIDGRAPTAKEVKEHRKAGVFEKHYYELREGRVELAIVDDLSLSLLMETYDYYYEGDEECHEVRCHRFADGGPGRCPEGDT